MGGDHAPDSTIAGAALVCANNPAVRFLLFGDKTRIQPLLASYPALEACAQIIHTDKAVKSDEKPSAALRSGKGTSMRLAIESVKEGRAQAVVSAGNTGALMALAKAVLKPLPGIHRPAIAGVFPTMGSETIMLDLGANVLVDAENLA
ncbi:MAG: phosphate acyltransferase, partial [Alphaproteobacteria bacterium]|nr:phosphate acyltransferase [Alphaproteobacteria bacterium]